METLGFLDYDQIRYLAIEYFDGGAPRKIPRRSIRRSKPLECIDGEKQSNL